MPSCLLAVKIFVTKQLKYLVFKGISKKEEILFKSFLNLVKRDLKYQVVILKDVEVDSDAPDIAILDENYQIASGEVDYSQLPNIRIGDDIEKQSSNYLSRPVQWSEFKEAITGLDVQMQVEEDSQDRVLPSDVILAINEVDDAEESADPEVSNTEPNYSDEGEYEYSLDKMSIDYHSFTNSDYVKVVDDVKQFHEEGGGDIQEPVILVTDDESASQNSVLVIETNSMDAWDLSESDFSVTSVVNEQRQSFDEPDTERVVLEQRAGLPIGADVEFWHEECEVIVDNKNFLFIKPARDMVYSDKEPGKWPAVLQRGGLTKAPIAPDWKPTGALKAYPLSSLRWVYTLTSRTSDIESLIDDSTLYQLESWPHFDLLELDNVLLKLCTMLFVRPESVVSLATKSGYGRSTIRGLMNACHDMGCLKKPEEISGDPQLAHADDEGMLGKIKDVFR